jgi:hypothetical protein
VRSASSRSVHRTWNRREQPSSFTWECILVGSPPMGTTISRKSLCICGLGSASRRTVALLGWSARLGWTCRRRNVLPPVQPSAWISIEMTIAFQTAYLSARSTVALWGSHLLGLRRPATDGADSLYRAGLNALAWTPSSTAISFRYTARILKARAAAKSSFRSMYTSRGTSPGRCSDDDDQGTS